MKNWMGILAGLLLVAVSLAWLLMRDTAQKTPTLSEITANEESPEPAKANARPITKPAYNPVEAANTREQSSGPSVSTDQEPFVAFISLLGQGAGHDIARLVDLYEGLEEGPQKYAAFFSLLKYWSKTDPDGAMEYALSVKVKERDKEILYADIYGEFAKRNPGEFVSSILLETNPDLRANKTAAAIQLLGESDPVSLIPAIEAEERQNEREDLLKLWVKDVTKNYPESVLDYIANFNDTETRQKAAASAMIDISRTVPELAGFHYSKLLYDTDTKVSVLPDIIKGYYRNADGTTVPVEQWIQNNLLTTEEYAVAAATMVELLVAENVDVALQWLDSIENENLYNATVQEIEKKYSKKSKSSEPGP